MSLRRIIDRGLGVAIEAIVLVFVVLSPWAFGAVEPLFEFFLYVGIAVLLVLWAGRVLCQWQFTWKKCPVALCLAAFFLLGIWQLQPLPRPVLNFLSPGTVRLLDELLPAEPELLPGSESYQRPALAAGNRLSLYPGATRKELIRLLVVFLLFVAVRNNVASPSSLRRLFFVLILNGCALAVFALYQFFTSPRDTVYWTYQTKGAVFGPFISRTHYPFYVNVCIGAGIGLLLSLGSAAGKKRRHRKHLEDRPTGILHDPPRLWLCCALALMMGSVALSMSRGGFLALVSGAVVLLLAQRVRFGRLGWVSTALLTLAAALALVSWMGGRRVEDRLATIWKGEAMQQSRLPLWTDSWPLVLEFPLLGTGYGTFAYAEPLHREHTASIYVHEHAHNEFLEALVEGGLVRLAISLAAIGVMFRLGFRAVRRLEGRSARGLALGALFGFATLVIHSIGDFGLHLPAIAFLTTVLCAQLADMGQSRGPRADDAGPEASADAYVFHAWGLAPAAGALTLSVLALVLWSEGRRMERTQTYRLTAAGLQGKTDPADRDRQLALYTAAARMMPESGRVVSELAQAHLDRFHQEQVRWRAATAGELVLAGATMSSLLPLTGSGELARVSAAKPVWDEEMAAQIPKQEQAHLIPALRAFLQARDICPLFARPHLQLALNHPYLGNAKPRSAYLDRAKRVVTNDAEYWFLFGLVEYLERQYPRASQSWRRSLEVSDRYLPEIVGWGRNGLGPQVLAEEVLPGRPELLLTVAERLYPGPKDTVQRRPFLEKALAELVAAPPPVKSADDFLKGRVLTLLGRSAEATAAYRQALAREPRQATWHLELAKLLRAQGRMAEAQRELLTVLHLNPADPQANELLPAVNRELEKD